MNKFSNYPLAPYILKTLDELNFETPSEIQELVIPKALKGNDIIGKSKTGSGKTHAYLIPLLNKIDPSIDEIQAVILTPTRELAMQVNDMIQPFIKNNPDISVKLITGGLDRSRMMEKLSNPHIVIGTPGRIKDIAFVNSKLNLSKVKTLVIDEADMVFESGFMDDVNVIAANLAIKLQMLVFSATIPEGLTPFLNKYMNNPLIVTPQKNETVTPNTITYYAVPSKTINKNDKLLSVISALNPYLCLIFSSKIENVEVYYKFLKENGIDAAMIHGDMSAAARRSVMKRINNHEYVYVIASDIAARGIDIEGVSHVINMDFPSKLEFFFHRAGRSGRMGKEGICISIYNKDELPILKTLKEQKVNFVHKDVVNQEFVDLRPLFREKPLKKKKEPTELDVKIRRIISENTPKHVKPAYKKKIKMEIEKAKRFEKRKIIRRDIQRQIREKAIKKLCESQNNED
jgi:ATP-dependent RNA helicase CshB